MVPGAVRGPRAGWRAVSGGKWGARCAAAVPRLGFSHRRDVDRRHLGRFLERAEQMQAFDDLLVSPPDEWALHYVGLGGVGKTMLVRHLTLLLTDDERFKGRAACARVDFDHLRPEYPTAAPGLLLELSLIHISEPTRPY